MKKNLLLLMALVLPMVVSASSELISGKCGDNATFVLDRYGTLTISGTGAMSGKKPWTDYSSIITRLIVDEGITSINSSAFYKCSSLSYVSLPSTLKTIESYAFENALNYSPTIVCNAVAPPSVGTDCFNESRLNSTKLYVPETAFETYKKTSPWSKFSNIIAFSHSTGMLAGSCGDNVNYVLGVDGTLTISGTGAMSDFTRGTQPWKDFYLQISKVVIAEGVTSIGAYAFYGCRCLSVNISSTVKSIGSYAFYNTQQLCEITSKASNISTIGADIFRNVPEDNIVLYVPASLLETYKASSWCSGFFRIIPIEQPDVIAGYCGNPLAYELSSDGTLYIHGATSSYDYTLETQPWASYRNQIKRIELSSHVYSLGKNLFNSCSALKTVVCHAKDVLGTSTGIFDNVPISSATLYVPASALDDYKAADVWKDFGTILPIGQSSPTLYIETDVTNQFPTDWQGWSGATGYSPTDFAPKVTTNDGRTVQVCEKFNYNSAELGTVFKRTLTGLTNGTYRIELYGAASSTKGRDPVDSEMNYSDDGDKTAVYLYAKTASGTVMQYIPVHWATSFSTVATAVLNEVKVTNGEVEIGMVSEKKFTNWHVVQIKGVTALVDVVELHKNALSRAREALNNSAYVNVVGSERTALSQAITSYSVVSEQTAQAYHTAASALNATILPFVNAKESYDNWAEFKSRTFPYASEAVMGAVSAAAAVLPANAADALNRVEAMRPLYRQYAESSAMLEGLEGAMDYTSSIKNPKAEEGLDGWTTVWGDGSGGSISILEDQPWIDGNGSTNHKYFDGGYWQETDWDLALQQEITLPAGRYHLTALGRSSGDVTLTLYAGKETAEMAHTNAEGSLFTLGWEQTSVEFELTENTTVSIGVRGVSHVIHNWMSFSEFRLVQFPSNTGILSGKCGENLDYVLTKEYDLQITGTGKMYDYSDSNKAPWDNYSALIQSVEIDNNVTSIGKRAFRDCSGLTSIIIPGNVTSIGQDAFRGCQFRTIVSKAVHPSVYSLEDAGFSAQEFNHTVLYVPENTYWNYVFDSDWYHFYHIKEYASTELLARQAYMLAEADGTNYKVYNSSRNALEVKGYAHQVDETSLDCNWVAEAYGSGYALLNLGAKKYADIDAEGRISLSNSPKALDIKFHEGSTTVNGHTLMIVINDNDIVTEIVNLHYTPSAADKSLDANAPIYDLNGRQLPKKPAKGHYIQSGRKKYIK
jgi:hypothetical protein